MWTLFQTHEQCSTDFTSNFIFKVERPRQMFEKQFDLKIQESFCLDHQNQAAGQNVNLFRTHGELVIFSKHLVSKGFDWQ